jgi:hypothetical protein
VHDLAELKNFVMLHARALGLDPGDAATVLDRVRSDDGRDGPGSWAGEWSSRIDVSEAAGDLPGAVCRAILASFPYPGDAARRTARDRALSLFDRWRRTLPDVRRLDVAVGDATVRCWATGLDGPALKPVVVVTGGIVSVKEQWAPFLLLAQQLGVAAVVTEMPGVGENTLPYRRESHRMYGAVLDALAGRADTTRTVLVALSFSGHLALRQAVDDTRISGVITVGAPVRGFFTDGQWWPRVPALTTRTIAHHSGVPHEQLRAHLQDWGLTDSELASLNIPVAYARSLRDEIIPGSDADLLKRHIPDLDLISFDDVHGSPSHVDETRAWMAKAVARMTGAGAGGHGGAPTVGALQGGDGPR